MNDFFGADTDALRALAGRVRTGTRRLQELQDELHGAVTSVEWTGPDADAFRGDFSGRVTALLARAGDGLAGRHAQLDTHAEEQDAASAASADGGTDAGGGTGGDGERSFQASLRDLLTNPVTAVASTLTTLGLTGADLWKGFKQGRNLLNLRTALGTLGPAAESAQTFLRNGMVDDAVGFLGKLGGVGKFLGAAGGVLGIVGGISDMIDPPHDGWRGVGDRIAGGLGVIGGAGGIAVALGAGAMLGPVGLGVVAAAGLGAGLWAAGNAIVDNWDSITSFVGDVGGHVTDFVSDAGDAIGGAVGAVGDFVGGLF